MKLWLIVRTSNLVLCISVIYALNPLRLTYIPKGIKSLDLKNYSGLWYIHFIINPCGWKGADEFSEWTVYYELEKRAADTCVETTLRQRLEDGSTIVIKDTFGDVASSRAVVLATDYRNYIITWGCVKASTAVDNKCDDFWLSAKFRKPYVSQKLLHTVNQLLLLKWGITTKNIVQVHHRGECTHKITDWTISENYELNTAKYWWQQQNTGSNRSKNKRIPWVLETLYWR